MRGLSGENGLAEDIVESIKQKDQVSLNILFKALVKRGILTDKKIGRM